MISIMAMAMSFLAVITNSAAAHPSTDINILSSSSTANLTIDPNPFKAWAQFCDDTDCSSNCGIWVDLSNSDCLQESGRRSVAIKSTGQSTEVGLIYSPANSCDCQQQCDQFSQTGCFPLNTSLAADTLSYRWVNIGLNDACAANNC